MHCSQPSTADKATRGKNPVEFPLGRHGSAHDPARDWLDNAAFRATFGMARPAERAVAVLTGGQGSRDYEVQRVVAHETRPLGGGAPLAHRRFQPARQRVPV